MCKMKARFQSLSEGLRNRLDYTFLAASSDSRVGEKQYHLIVPARKRHRAERSGAPTEREAKPISALMLNGGGLRTG